MSISLFEIKSAQAGRLLEKFGLSHKSKNGTYKKAQKIKTVCNIALCTHPI